MELPNALLGPSLKNKKSQSRKIFLIFQEMELSDSKIKNFFIFPEMKSCTFKDQARKIKSTTLRKFLIFQELEIFYIFYILRKLFLHFQKWNFPYFRKLKPHKKNSHISGKRNLYSRKWKPSQKNSLYFMRQNILIFQEELRKPQNPKFLIFLQENS